MKNISRDIFPCYLRIILHAISLDAPLGDVQKLGRLGNTTSQG